MRMIIEQECFSMLLNVLVATSEKPDTGANERFLIPSFSMLNFCRFRLEDEKPKRFLSYLMGAPMIVQGESMQGERRLGERLQAFQRK